MDRIFGNSRRRLSWCSSLVASHTPLSAVLSHPPRTHKWTQPDTCPQPVVSSSQTWPAARSLCAAAAPQIQDQRQNQPKQYYSCKNGHGDENAHRIHQDELAASRVEPVEAADGRWQREQIVF